jgi:branched-chain amino acid aminotransferase
MKIPIGIVESGVVQPAPYSATSLAEAATKEPQGVYTVGRTFRHDQVVLFEEHLNRLERSAQLEHMSLRLDRVALRRALRSLIEQSGYADVRFRITIPRESPEHPIITLEPFQPIPKDVLEKGVRVVTVHLQRHNPAAKTTEWMTTRKAATDSFEPGIYEGILVSDSGLLLEGTNSNFYAIRDDRLRTADDNAVLSGIARRILLTVAPDIVLVELEPVNVNEIPQLSEAMLTSSSRGVVPIVEIDGQRIGNGKPGSYTLKLREAYEAWVNAHLEPI